MDFELYKDATYTYGDELEETGILLRHTEKGFQYPDYNLQQPLVTKNRNLAADRLIEYDKLPPESKQMRDLADAYGDDSTLISDPVKFMGLLLNHSDRGWISSSTSQDLGVESHSYSLDDQTANFIAEWYGGMTELENATTTHRSPGVIRSIFNQVKQATKQREITKIRLLSLLLSAHVSAGNHILSKDRLRAKVKDANGLNKFADGQFYQLPKRGKQQQWCYESHLTFEGGGGGWTLRTLGEASILILKSPGGDQCTAAFGNDFLRCWADTLESRWLTLVICSITIPDTPYNIPKFKTVRKMYQWGDMVLRELGNQGYPIIKSLEPVCASMCQLKLNQDDQLQILDKVPAAIISAYEESIQSLPTSYPSWTTTLRSLEPPIMIELMSLYRHFGHPFVDPSIGLVKLHNHATLAKEIDHPSIAARASDLAKIILRSYYYKHQLSWPECSEISSSISPLLASHIKHQTFPKESEMSRIGDNWHLIRHGRVFDHPSEVSLTEFLGDKSHSVDRNELINILRRTKNINMASSTRKLLITALETDYVDIDAFLNLIDSAGLCEEDLIIGLKPKEREVKVDGRFFSLMSFPLRMYFVATEYLIARDILPLFPEITMKSTYTDLMKDLCESTSSRSQASGKLSFMIHLDFEKWNNHQRHDATAPIFRVIDKCYTWTNVIARTHEFFEASFIYYAGDLSHLSNTLEPQLPWSWEGHLGGLEGLRQKGWTVCGALMLREVAKLHAQRFKILMQGDNQVVVVTFQTNYLAHDQGYREERLILAMKALKILDSIVIESGKSGLITKREETWVSSNLLLYGKYPIIGGTCYGMLLKRLSRLYSTSNDTTPSLCNILSSITTTGLTATQLCNSAVLPLCCAYWYMTVAISKAMEYSPILGKPLLPLLYSVTTGRRRRGAISNPRVWNPRSSANLYQRMVLRDLMFRESIVGGTGGTTPARYLIRQFPDPLTEALTAYSIGLKRATSVEIKELMIKLKTPELSPRVSSYKRLLEDPKSLNLISAPNTKDVAKRKVAEYLRSGDASWITNVEFRAALGAGDTERDKFVGELFQISPMFPSLLSNLYAATPYGIRESFINRISGPRTILTIATKTIGSGLTSALQGAETRVIELLQQRVMIKPTDWQLSCSTHCSTRHAQNLREKGWKKKMIGATIPHPLEQWKVMEYTHKEQCCGTIPIVKGWEKEFILTLVNPELGNSPWKIRDRGPGTAYFGSATDERRTVLSACEVRSSEPLLQRCLDLYRVINWFVRPDEPIADLIRLITFSLTDYDLTGLEDLRVTTSGDALHRYFSQHDSRGGFNATSPNGPSHFSITGDYLTMLGRGEDNKIILFQGVFLMTQTVAAEGLMWDCNTTPTYHTHPNCQECMIEAEQFTLSVPAEFKKWSLPHRGIPMFPNPRNCLPPFISRPDDQPHQRKMVIPFFTEKERVSVSVTWMQTTGSQDWERFSQIDIGNCMALWAGLDLVSRTTHNACLAISDKGILSTTFFNWAGYDPFMRATIVGCYIEEIISVSSSFIARGLEEVEFDEIKHMAITRWARGNVPGPIVCNIGHSKFLDALVHNDTSSSFSFPVKHKEIGNSVITAVGNGIEEMTLHSLREYAELFQTLFVPSDMRAQRICVLVMAVIQALKGANVQGGLINVQMIKLTWTEATPKKLEFSRIFAPQKVDEEETEPETRSAAAIIASLLALHQGLSLDWKSLISALDPWSEPEAKLLPRATRFAKLARVICSTECDPTAFDHLERFDPEKMDRSPMNHFVRCESELTTAWYKIHSILSINDEFIKNVVCIGDGNGGFSSYIVTHYPYSQVWFNSLVSVATNGRDTLSPKPPASLIKLDKGSQGRIVNLKDSIMGVTDITNPRWPEFLAASTRNFQPSCLISDAEFPTNLLYQRGLQNIYLALSRIPTIQRAIIKIHLSRVKSEQPAGLVMHTLSKYGVVRLWRSQLSNFGAGELYLEWVRGKPVHIYSLEDCLSTLTAGYGELLQTITVQWNFLDRMSKSYVFKTGQPSARSNGLQQRVFSFLGLASSDLPRFLGGSRGEMPMRLVHYLLDGYLNDMIYKLDWRVQDQHTLVSFQRMRKLVAVWLGLEIALSYVFSDKPKHRKLLDLYSKDKIYLVIHVFPTDQRRHFTWTCHPERPYHVDQYRKRHYYGTTLVHLHEVRHLAHDAIRWVGSIFWSQKGRAASDIKENCKALWGLGRFLISSSDVVVPILEVPSQFVPAAKLCRTFKDFTLRFMDPSGNGPFP
ncbi:L protein [Wenling dimarhabdovirus 8]|uniref:Replicase n=1 Tax=Wenling dimarhabdovirus 8 TaxID=2116361 RepID=A0A2P1GNB0_9RHAB|nr:L protein [Wenling dimarhabdovirus 8]